MSVAQVIARLAATLSLCLAQDLTAVDLADSECPPWHFTPVNTTPPCSQCVWLYSSSVYCSTNDDTSAMIDTSTIMTATNGSYPLFLGRVIFDLDLTKGLHNKKNIMFRELPPNPYDSEEFFCSTNKRRGFLCSQCKPGCGVALYAYFGLPCACPCYSYGIPLYILLEIGFSTIFYLFLVGLNISVISSKWTTLIFYFSVSAHIISSQTHSYIVMAESGPWVPIVLHTLYGVWNMDFFRFVIPKFCVGTGVSVLGAISTGYISAFWPMILVLFTSLAMHLHKQNFKIAVYSWNILNWVTLGSVQRRVAGTNLIHVFVTFFLLCHLKMVYISISLIKPLYTSLIPSQGQGLAVEISSIDPRIKYSSFDHLFYAVPAMLILVLVGLLLPLSLMLYPTRCGTLIGTKFPSGRLRNAVRTFMEAFNGYYKDGSDGTRDYRTLPGFLLLLRGITIAAVTFGGSEINREKTSLLCVGFILMALAGVFGVLQPYKIRRHNLHDVMILCLTALQCFYFVVILTTGGFETAMVHAVAAATFVPLIAVFVGVLKPLVVKCTKRVMLQREMLLRALEH